MSTFAGAARRGAVPLALTAAALWLAWDRLAAVDLAMLGDAVAATPPGAALLAAMVGLVSHAALALYDVVTLPRVGARLPFRAAAAGGFAATTLGQALGASLAVTAATRWRVHRALGLGAAQSAAASALVGSGFMIGALTLAAGLAAIRPEPAAALLGLDPATARAGALAALGAPLLLRWRWLFRRPVRVAGVAVDPPDRTWTLRMAALTWVDLLAAATAFWLVIPDAAGVSFAAALAVYVAALALGQASAAPAGLGAFDAALLIGLGHVAPETVLAAAAAYRAVYLGPAILVSLVVLARAPRAPAPERRSPGAAELAALAAGGRAEGDLARMGDKGFVASPCGGAVLMLGARGRDWVALGDPHGPREAWAACWAGFAERARRAGARASVYKATDADFWRARGLRLQPLGEEASLDARTFSLEGPARRELRRKLAQARKAGVAVAARPAGRAPCARLAGAAAAWRREQGGEMTFSMGRFDAEFLRGHRLFEARRDGACLGFVSLACSGDGGEAMIDVMRLSPDAPSGTMHALCVAAIEAAAAAGAARVNLGMAPLSGMERLAPVTLGSRALGRIYAAPRLGAGARGLRRFKEAFRPDWAPRYMAAKGPVSAALGLAAARALVTAPTPEIDVAGLRAAEAFLAADAESDSPRAEAPERAQGRRAAS